MRKHKSYLRKIVALLLTCLLIVSVVPISINSANAVSTKSYIYNPDMAIAFAKKHCNTDSKNHKATSGVDACDNKWLCAEFVYNCLKAGGLTVYKKGYNVARANELGIVLQDYGTKIDCSTTSTLKLSNFSNKLTKGDVVIVVAGKNSSNTSGHAVIYSGETDANDNMLFYAHNSRKENKVYKPSAANYPIKEVYAIHFTGNKYNYTSYDAQKVVSLCLKKVGSNYKNGYCLAFVKDMFKQAYDFTSTSCCAYNYGNKYLFSESQSNIPLGADVFFGGSSKTCSNCGSKCGHIGIYVGDGYIVHAWSGIIRKMKISQVVNAGYPYRGWGWHGNIALDSEVYNISANAVTQSKTTNNSTEFNVGISPKANVEKIGVFYSTKANKSSLININSETEHKSTNKYNYYLLCEKPSDKKINTYQFDTAKKTTQNGWTIKFNPNQEYAYRFVVKIGNKWFISNTNYFSTKNDIPAAVTNVGVSGDKQIGIAKTTTITWKKSDKATEYFVNVTNGEGKSVLSKTLKGVNSTTYQTEPLGSPDTYTVHITAKNSSGSSSESITTFEVMPNIKATFDSGIGTPQTLTITYNDCVTTPNAPNREGYQFDGWRYSENNTIVKSGVKINNIKSDVTYTAVWTPKKYTVNIVDGISQKTILSTSQSFGTDFNVAKYISDNNISIPEHNYYEYVGLSENVYNVKAETHTIYVRYKWNSVNSVEAKIEEGGIKRTKSVNSEDNKKNDGYSIDVKVSTPSIESGGTDKTVKGRVVVALKTDAGRLLIETESAAFVLYPQQKDEVSKIINVFVPYEATNESQLPTAIEAYVVNNYYSAGIISNIAKNNAELMAANSLEDNWKYSSTPIQVGDVLSNGEKVVAVDSNEDYYTYDLVTTTTKESLDSSMNGYTLLSTKWSNTLWQGTVSYVKNWPSLVSNGGDQFDNTKGAGQYIYNKYNNTPVTSSESDDMKIEVIEQPCDYIYYHWCKNRDNGNLIHHVTAHKTGDYNTFHCHSLSPSNRLDFKYISADNIKSFEYEYDASGKAASYRDRCTDSKYWEKEIPVYLQGWYTHKKIFTYSKTDVNKGIVVYNEDNIEKKSSSSTSETKEFPVNDIELNTTVEKHPTNITHWYAYKPENNTITHEDKNIIQGGVSGFVGKEYAMKNATVYIYKSNQVSDFTTEFIEGTIIASDGKFKIDTVQTREAISSETGDFTIAVAIEGETNAIVTGTIKAPLPVDSYKVRFVSATDKKDANGNIVYDAISEQNVVPGEAAYLPDESDIPKKEGYHFVCWNQSAEIVNGDMTVQAIYEANEYAIVFVDWESKKIDIKKCKYGESFIAPELPQVADDTNVEWVIGDGSGDEVVSLNEWVNNGGIVTNDMIISAKYTLKDIALTIIDLSNVEKYEKSVNTIENVKEIEEVISDFDTKTETLEYGDIIQLDEYESDYSEDCLFIGWKNAVTGEFLDNIEIKNDMTIYPVYEFAETVDLPEASVKTGEYINDQTVSLSCNTENAVIFYTIDGSNPLYSDTAKEYTSPITLSKSCTLKFCASAFGMNNSGTVAELYAINTTSSGVKYHLITVYSNLPQQEGEYYQALIKDSLKFSDSEFKNIEGYTYDGLFCDEKFTEEFYVNSETITEESTLYAKYTPKQYTATFVDDEGNILKTSVVDYGESAEAPASNPTKDGYVFIGWDSNDYECLTTDKKFVAQFCPEDEYVKVELRKSKLSIEAGSEPIKLSTIITPSDAENVELIWNSSDPGVVEVDSEGCITPLSEGMSIVTVMVESTGEFADCTVTVTENISENIVIGKGSILDIDSAGYLRGITEDDNEVSNIRNQFLNENLEFYDINGNKLENNDLVGTGSVIKLVENNEILDELTVIMTGDTDGDGKVGIRDATVVQIISAFNSSNYTYEQGIASDVNGDGVVNIVDATIIQKYIVQILPSLG